MPWMDKVHKKLMRDSNDVKELITEIRKRKTGSTINERYPKFLMEETETCKNGIKISFRKSHRRHPPMPYQYSGVKVEQC